MGGWREPGAGRTDIGGGRNRAIRPTPDGPAGNECLFDRHRLRYYIVCRLRNLFGECTKLLILQIIVEEDFRL